ncbi:unnamed protein product [Dibothriocephalus latus]|uniref:Uncharacterized protein n=1 Tax=Dibothriocephalus latus TaxID=60516 RepID=A0A3P7MNY6_DIBLA|nr:unnamed protein product [Dibothriocephalus latus]
MPVDACFAPNSQFVISTSPTDGFLHIWALETGGGALVASLPSFEAASQMANPTLHCVLFNPRFAMLATGSQQTSFWLPNIDE